MSKGELIEEIYVGLSAVSWGFQPKDAEELITRIGKAYADGELELPGEVGRGTVDDEIGALQCFLAILPPKGMRFIALCKEEENELESR